MNFNNKKISIIGLGYVGLPLAVAFSKKYSVIGFDINKSRVNEINMGIDHTLEIKEKVLKKSLLLNQEKNINGLFVSSDVDSIKECNVFIITVPTPIDKHNRPVLTPMIKASEMVASIMKKGDIVIYESTVYPGVTEDEMVPVLERVSNLRFNKDFYCGYSPERINPGDKKHTVTKILKITSGSTPETAEFIDQMYKSVITAGTFKASSIKVAEAAKVIENSQRDINIAFVNELSKIFGLMGLDTNDVLEAAGTKWNFLKFQPGLVGGHCIGVDPYYIAQKAQELGYNPEIILAGRRLNDSMGKYVADAVIKLMMKKSLLSVDSKVLILGFTFKENCPDIRNTRVIDIYKELAKFGLYIDIFDPWANRNEVKREYNIDLVNNLPEKSYDAYIFAVAHDQFKEIKIVTSENSVVYDIKGVLPRHNVDARL
tara:strand:+ start:382 stop:1668 length:1287 start_codon:yes stop_codon:yes gene_type:complete